MEIKMVAIDQLRPAEYNPRKISDHDMKELKNSLKKFGFVEPIIVNQAAGREGVIIGGHQRLAAARGIGMTEVPVFWVEIDDLKKEKELNVRLNKNQGEFDFDLLKDFFEPKDLLDWGFEEKYIDWDKKNIKEETDPIPEAPNIPRSKLGDFFKLGNHVLFCGDSTNLKHFEKLMGGGQGTLGLYRSTV